MLWITVLRARRLINKNLVGILSMTINILFMDVDGYSVLMERKNGDYSSTCGCKTNKECYHIMAVKIFIKELNNDKKS